MRETAIRQAKIGCNTEILKCKYRIFSLNFVINLPKAVTGNLKTSTVFVSVFEMLVLFAQVISEG